MITYAIQEHAEYCSIAVGATLGKQHLEPLLDILESKIDYGSSDCLVPSEIILMDFSGVEAANGSYLKALLLPLLQSTSEEYVRDYSCLRKLLHLGIDLYPVVTGLSEDVRLELAMVLRDRENPLACIETQPKSTGELGSGHLLGALDPILIGTLKMLCHEKQATASDLHSKYAGERITITGWNNRLADLYKLRLAARIKVGRQWVYMPIVKEITNGTRDGEGSRQTVSATAK